MHAAPLVPTLALMAFAALTGRAGAEEPMVFAVNGVAISGYDTVIYLTEHRAAKGSPDHALLWRGATWQFVSAETMEVFEMNPTAYAPQFGGYCAEALSEGRLAPSSPDTFAVIDGKLYLISSDDDRGAWSADPRSRIALANQNWPGILGQ